MRSPCISHASPTYLTVTCVCIELVHASLQRGDSAAQMASALCETAVELSKDVMRLSPVVLAMAREGHVARGREAQDDVTVVVAHVLSGQSGSG